MCDSEIKETIDTYIRARSNLIDLGRKYPERVGGNDNLVGRIGEFIALRFLEHRLGQNPSKVPETSNPGYDFIDGELLTQVKTITSENQRGRSVRLVEPWNQLVLIELGEDYKPKRIGVLTEAEHQRACEENPGWSRSPIVKLSMLSTRGLIGRYGTVFDGSAVDV